MIMHLVERKVILSPFPTTTFLTHDTAQWPYKIGAFVSVVLFTDFAGMELRHSNTHMMLLWFQMPPSYLYCSAHSFMTATSINQPGMGLESVTNMVSISQYELIQIKEYNYLYDCKVFNIRFL